VSNAEFNAKARVLERKGLVVYGMGTASEILVEGSAGFEVEELQRYLRDEGFYTSSYGITGYFGPVTKQAVIKWQKANGVLSTGNFGGMSRAKYLELQDLKLSKQKKKGGGLGLFRRKKQDQRGNTAAVKPKEEEKRIENMNIGTQSRSFDAKTSEVVSIVQPARPSQGSKASGRQAGFGWGTALVFFVTLAVCWQTLTMYYKKKQEGEMERRTMERDRAVQISRWMRTIDTDRRA
jgi:hypothetical protein